MYIARSVATWSLRERAVWSLPPTGPTHLGQVALDGHVDVFVVRRRRRSGRRELALDRIQAAQQPSRSSSEMMPPRGEHRGVGARLRDVLRPQTPVEADRGVHADEVGMLGLVEAGHGAAVYAAMTAGTMAPLCSPVGLRFRCCSPYSRTGVERWWSARLPASSR